MEQGLKRAGILCLLYGVWMLAFHLIAITIMTYVLMSQNPKFQDINDLYTSNEILLVAIGSVLFVSLLRLIYPILSTTQAEVISRITLVQRFLPGLAQGTLLAILLTLSFQITGVYRYLGFFVQAEDSTLAGAGVILRMFTVIAWIYAEEFVLRQKILSALRSSLNTTTAILVAALASCVFKVIQFDLGARQIFTVLLISTLLGVRAVIAGEFARGAGFFAGFLAISHAIFSLPIFGSDFQGAFLFRYEPDLIGGERVSEITANLAQWVTGGPGGPLSSIAFQTVLIAELTRLVWRNKRLFIVRRTIKF